MYQRHPLSAAFPSMTAAEQDSLTLDIEKHGQREAITIYDGHVLDGWHRYQSCMMLEIKPITIDMMDGVDPVAYVISVNLHRRHLTGSQRAIAVASCHEWANVGKPKKVPGTVLKTIPEMAKQAEVSAKTIQLAKRVVEAGLSDEVKNGNITVKRAAEIAKLPEKERKAAVSAPKPKAENMHSSMMEVDISEYEEACNELSAMRKIFDADDKLSAAVKAYKDLLAQYKVAESRIDSLITGKNEAEKAARSWRKKCEDSDRKLTDYQIREIEGAK